MAKKSKNAGVNVNLFEILQSISEEPRQTASAKKALSGNEPPKNRAVVAVVRLGGLKGGKASDAALSKNRKAEIAKKAAKVRWAKEDQKPHQRSSQ